MDPIMIPITLAIGTVVIAALIAYRVKRHNKILGIAIQSANTGQTVPVSISGTYRNSTGNTIPAGKIVAISTPTKTDIDLYY